MQAQSITKLAEANREAGLKEAEVLREKLAAANTKSRRALLQEAALPPARASRRRSCASWSSRPSGSARSRCCSWAALGGLAGGSSGAIGSIPLLGGALGPMMQTILETSAMLPVLKEVMKFVDMNAVTGALSKAVQVVDPATVSAPLANPPLAGGVKTAVRVSPGAPQ